MPVNTCCGLFLFKFVADLGSGLQRPLVRSTGSENFDNSRWQIKRFWREV